MSNELHVLLPTDDLPTRAAWQRAIDALGLPVVLDDRLQFPHSGFTPCWIRGRASGFELHVDALADLLASYPTLRGKSHGSQALSFRWGGDLLECACVVAAAAGLVHGFAAVAYDPGGDTLCDVETLTADFAACTIGE